MRRKAFTLVEILIVVIILGILAAIVLPRFSNASAIARASMLADDLRIVRMQIQVFKAQHRSVAPGYPVGSGGTPTADLFQKQMTLSSNPARVTVDQAAPGYRYGPYLRAIPTNPVNGKNTVQIIGAGAEFPSEADDSHGWIYQPSTLRLAADSKGDDSHGNLYFEY